MKVTIGDRLVAALARTAIWLAARTPEWLGYGVAGVLGRVYFRLDRRRRRNALRFLRVAFPDRPEAELLRLGADATANVFKVPLDMARLTRLLARGGDLREVADLSAIEDLLRRPGPWLGLTAHLGSWEVAAIACAQRPGGACGVARVAKNPLLQRWILTNRQRGGLRILPRRGGVRQLAAELAAGGVGLQVVDQHQRLRGVVAPFFGRPASCERAAVSLALRRGLPITVGAALRVGRGFRFRMVAMPTFVLASTGDRQRDLVAGVTRVNAAIEALVRQAPEQYLWLHDRYRASVEAAGAAPSHGGSGGGTDDGDDDA